MVRKQIGKLLVLSITILITAASASAQDSDLSYKEYLRLTSTAARALESGSFDAALTLADRLLSVAKGRESDWNFGNAVHVAHLVRGRVALARGDVKTAEAELLASVSASNLPYGIENSNVKGWRASPGMDSFGPDMTLAAELLAKSGPDIVLRYFDLCAAFWSADHGALDRWRTDIREGRKPDFGPNLVYFFPPVK